MAKLQLHSARPFPSKLGGTQAPSSVALISALQRSPHVVKSPHQLGRRSIPQSGQEIS